MKFFTKKRIVLFLLFIFPLICFLILSTGTNNFTKLPILTKDVVDVSEIDSLKTTTLENHISVVCFLGDETKSLQPGILALNEKIYKTFLDYKQFQVIAIYPKGTNTDVKQLKDNLAAFTDMQNWVFIESSRAEIEGFYETFNIKEPLVNLSSNNVFLIDKENNLRGRTNDDDAVDGKLYGYNINSVSVLNSKLKDDIKVLYYEYYAAFKDKNKNKADRKEVGLWVKNIRI